MSSTPVIIPPFRGGSGACAAYAEFRARVLGAAYRTRTPNDSLLGLLGFLLSKQQWADSKLVQRAELGAFVPIPHPGSCAASPAETYGDRLKTHAILMDWYRDEQGALMAFTKALLDALDEPTQRLLADDGGGTEILEKSLQEIMAVLDATYGTMASSDVDEYATQLKIPYIQGTDVLAFFSAKTELHRILALHDERYPEATKIRLARKALEAGGGPTYTAERAIFEENCRLADPPRKQTWAGYRDAMIAASKRIHETTTIGAAGFGANAVEGNNGHCNGRNGRNDTSPQDQHSAEFAAAVKAGVTAELRRRDDDQNRRDRGGGGGGSTRTRTRTRDLRYCYSHGWQYSHTSASCEKRRNGHDEKANTHVGAGPGANTKGAPTAKSGSN
jgi:hypothetical protein